MRFVVIEKIAGIDVPMSIHEDVQTAVKAKLMKKHFYMPIMTLEEWLKTHKDFRSLYNGNPTIMWLDADGATVSGPVYLIESWDSIVSYQRAVWERYSELIRS